MTFAKAIETQLKLVGGWDAYLNIPIDFGGPTKGGIHQRDIQGPIYNTSTDRLLEVYHHFWNQPMLGNSLPLTEALGDGPDFVFFNMNVELGALAYRLMQEALGVPPTSNFDEPTQAAFMLAIKQPKQLTFNLLNRELAYYWFQFPQVPYRTIMLERVGKVYSIL